LQRVFGVPVHLHALELRPARGDSARHPPKSAWGDRREDP
jgi:hypothetical protein